MVGFYCCFRSSTNTICSPIMVGFILLLLLWWYYGLLCRCCSLPIDIIYSRIMVGFVVVR
jgi:hypothetical protein